MNAALPLDDYLSDLLAAPAATPVMAGVVVAPIVADAAVVDVALDVAVAAAGVAASAATPARIAPAPAVAAAVQTPAAAIPPSVPRGADPAPPAALWQAPAAADTYRQRRAADRSTRWLRLRCDQQHYALELLKVQEVIRPGLLLPLRGAARHMLGVMNLRGHVVPVMDLSLYLGRAVINEDASTRIVILEENGDVLGLRVTAVEDVTRINDPQIEAPDDTRISRITNPVFRGVARLGEHTIILLDASRLLQ